MKYTYIYALMVLSTLGPPPRDGAVDHPDCLLLSHPGRGSKGFGEEPFN